MSRAVVALFGDWNAQATKDTGRYSPAWIARQLKLHLAHAGPGRHGNIDYSLTNAAVRSRRRVGNGAGVVPGHAGSDHDALLYVLDARESTAGPVRVLQWNLQRDRPVRVVARQLVELVNEHNPDVLVLQEAAQYVQAIGAFLPAWHITTGARQVNQQNVIAVLRSQGRVIQLSDDGWTTTEGHEHGPIFSPAVKIDGWLHIAGVHMPPSVNWTRAGKGMPYGPARRVAVYVSAARKLVRVVRRWQRNAARP